MSTIKVSNLQNASAASPAIVLDANSRATLNGLSYPTEGSLSGRNRIINGDMRIDQRNAGASQTVTTSGAYTVDRWYVQPNGASVTTQRVTGSGSYQNALRITGAASVTECFVQQKIESLNSYDLAGQTITVTIRASSSTLTSLTCYVERATAGVDNWSTFVTDKTQSITINSTPANYTFQATLSGSATNGIRFIFATGAFTSGTLEITGVQLEAGSVATPFERRSYGQELSLCQRYYQQIGGNTFNNPTSALYAMFGSGITYTTSQADISIPLKVSMRSTPTFSQSTAAVQQGANVYAATSIADAGSTPNVIFARVGIGTASLTTGGGANYFANNNATGFFAATSEL